MERKRVTFKIRTLQIVLEIVAALLCLGILAFGILSLLYGKGVINTSGKEQEIDVEILRDAESISEISGYLHAMKVDFVVVDEGRMREREMEEKDFLFVEKALETRTNVNNTLEKYIFLENEKGFRIVLRIPTIPEFSDRVLRKNHDFHSLFNRTVLLLALLVVIVPFIRFIRDIRREFYLLNDHICSNDVPKTENCENVGIREVKHSIFLVEEMKKKLVHGIDMERKAKEDLLFQIAALSHDLKTPLTIVKGNVGLLEETDTEEEREECFQSIDKGIRTIEDYLDEMILYSKLVFSSKEKNYVDVLNLYRHILDKIKGFREEKIHVETRCEIGALTIFCSERTIERAVLNLLVNAFEYAETTVRFEVRAEESEIHFEVYNDGEAIEKETMENMGKLFYTRDKGRNSRSHYGLGLYFVRRIAEEHGGELVAENLEDGVLFRFTVRRESPSR